MNTQHDDTENLFENISIDSFTENLITVDVPEDQQQKVEKEITDGGEPEKKEPEKKEPTKEPAVKPVEQTIVVDEDKSPETIKEDTAEKDKDKGGTPDEDEDESPSYLHAAALREEGVLPNLDIDKLKGKDPEEVFKAMNSHIREQVSESVKAGIEQYKNGFGDRAQQFLEALDKGVPFEEMANNYALEDRYNGINDKVLESDEEAQKMVYADLLNIKGFSESKIGKMVEKALQDGELLEESKEGLKEINTIILDERKASEAEAQRIADERKAKNVEMKGKIEKSIGELKEIIPGIALDEAEKQTLIKDLTVPVRYVNRDGRQIPVSKAMDLREKDPLKYETRLNYLINKGFFDDNAKFDELVRKAETNAAKKFVDKMKGEPRKSGKTTVKGTEGEKPKEEKFIFPKF